MLVGATSGGACSVWMTREDWLKGLAPTTFACLMRNLREGTRENGRKQGPAPVSHGTSRASAAHFTLNVSP